MATATFITALRAEHLKKKGTGIYLVGFIISAIVPLVGLIGYFVSDPVNLKSTFPANAFVKYFEEFTGAFSSFFFPLAIIIAVSRIAQLDHRYGGWQLMETLPVHKRDIYFSKFTVALIHNLICILGFVGLSILIVAIGSQLKDVPQGVEFSLPIGFISQLILRLFVASLFLTALQYLLAVLMPSFIWAILIGFFGLLSSQFAKGFGVRSDWNPFGQLAVVGDFTKGSQLGRVFLYTEWLSLYVAIFLCLFGFSWYFFRYFRRAFLKGRRLALSVLVLTIFAAGMYWQLKASQFGSAANTVIAGKLESDRKFSTAYLIDPFTTDTLAAGPVQNGAFRIDIKREIPLGVYSISFSPDTGENIVLSAKDSLFVAYQVFGNDSKIEITGTRLAENQTSLESNFSWSRAEWMIRNNEFLDKPDDVAKAILGDWKDEVDESAAKRTRDNFIPKPDFLSLDRKRISLRYLNLWNDFQDKRKALYPNTTAAENADIATIRKELSLRDQTLLGEPSYMSYLSHELTAKDTADVVKNAKELQAVSKLEAGNFKDRLLFATLKSALAEASGTRQRAEYYNGYAAGIEDTRLKALIGDFYKAQERMAKGNPAPEFQATDLDGKLVNLSAFKGKYVVIDVWATWCGPCKTESPFFEAKALETKRNDIVFVALSVDKNSQEWYLQAKTKSKQVKQLHIRDGDAFSKAYDIETIPRFLFIGPDGNFISSRMIRPSQPDFAALINKELKIEDY